MRLVNFECLANKMDFTRPSLFCTVAGVELRESQVYIYEKVNMTPTRTFCRWRPLGESEAHPDLRFVHRSAHKQQQQRQRRQRRQQLIGSSNDMQHPKPEKREEEATFGPVPNPLSSPQSPLPLLCVSFFLTPCFSFLFFFFTSSFSCSLQMSTLSFFFFLSAYTTSAISLH